MLIQKKTTTITGAGFLFVHAPVEHRGVYVHVYLCVESHRCPLSILSHFMSVVEVVGEGRLLVFVHQIWVGGVCSYGYC